MLMASNNDLFLNLGHLSGLGMADFNRDDVKPYQRPGTIAWVVDAFGPRIVKYIKNVSGSIIAKGELMSYASDGANVKSTSVTNITSGTTTSFVTSGLTANRHNGMIAYVLDVAAVAGAAPEGESSIVASNTTTNVTLESDYAYSSTLAVNDDIELIATYQVEDAAGADEAWTVAGVVLAKDGVSDGNYGWIQVEGVTPALSASSAVEGDPLEAGTATFTPLTGGHELWCGIALSALSTDEALKQIPVHVKLFSTENTGGTP
jgi:hypothetical protein